MEAYVLSRKNIASSLYPELFNISSDFVDKDGLTDYKILCQRMKQVQPGVFLDNKHNLLIFAHKFLDVVCHIEINLMNTFFQVLIKQ